MAVPVRWVPTGGLYSGPPAPDEQVFFTGEGPSDGLCGSCNRVLARSIDEGQLVDLTLSCPGCGAENKT